jgi:hypothetical protein
MAQQHRVLLSLRVGRPHRGRLRRAAARLRLRGFLLRAFRRDDAPEGEPVESHPQDEIEDGVSISGILSCDGCEGSLIVRVEDAGSNPPQLLTSATFESAGSFTIQSPRDKKVVLMVIHDADGSGGPTPGEGIGLWTGGLLNTSTDTTDVELTVGVMPDTPPIDPGVQGEEPTE